MSNFSFFTPDQFELCYIQRMHDKWQAEVEDEGRIANGIGSTPQEAVNAAIASCQAKPHAQATFDYDNSADDLLTDIGLAAKPQTIKRRV